MKKKQPKLDIQKIPISTLDDLYGAQSPALDGTNAGACCGTRSPQGGGDCTATIQTITCDTNFVG